MGPRAGRDEWKNSSPPGFYAGPSSPSSIPIPTELSTHSGSRVIPFEWTDKRVDRHDALESLQTRLRQYFFERPLCLTPLKIETETHPPRLKDQTVALEVLTDYGENFVLVTGDLSQPVPGK